ncbi:MAG TPA: asparagine synthase (glutamine-hydrolyzing), partial [candidate division WWE3 bacterium]|nr:asparagine synthase (glutamine-hydrolyzing) [candidate division WWE3 bacterium]
MCGIAGYAGKNINPASLKEALKTISHRGPDDFGLEIFSDIGLGHQRLSILDLSSAGHQPMFSQDKDIVLVFNGEIYNFQDIKKQLLGKYKFSSQTDSEVIIYAYKEWGTDCLQHFNGMFSFVLYDRAKNLLFGARDRLGEKPLKYYWNGEKFFFASEVKAIISFLKSVGVHVDPDPYAIDDFLTFGYVPAPKTGFKNIYKLPPAHFFTLCHGELNIKRYWSIDFTQKLPISYKEWQEEILNKLEESIKLRLMSDVPLGAFLSGGIDSSVVVAYAARNFPSKLKTFSMGFDDPEFDETKYAQTVANKYNTDHHVFRVSSSDLIENIDLISSFYDEPFADDSNLPTFLLSQKTKEHVTVVLNGDGGDENFGGYERYAVVEFGEFYSKIPSLLRNVPIKKLVNMYASLKKDKFSSRLNVFVRGFDAPFYRRYADYNMIFSRQ